MKLLVEDVLKMDCMNSAKVIAGHGGLKNSISFTTIMDVPEIIKWLHGGEMIFAAKLFYDCTCEEFFMHLSQKSVSAVITKPAYIGNLDERLIRICDKLYLPIITIDQSASWGDVTYPITELIARKQYDVIYQSQLFHSALLNSLIHGKTLNHLCCDIYKTTGLTTAIVDTDFSISGCSSNIEWENVLDKFTLHSCNYRSMLARDVNGIPTSGYIYNNFYVNSFRKQVFVFRVTQDGIVYSYIFLLVDMDIEFLEVLDSMKISQLSLIVALAKVKRLEIMNIIRRYNNLLLDRILQGIMSDPGERSIIENSIQQPFHDFYYIVLANNNDIDGKTNIIKQSIYTSRLFENLNKNNYDFKDMICFERGDDLVFFIPKNDIDIKRTINNLYSICKKTLETNSLYFGISNIVKNTDFPLGYDQAAKALQYIRSIYKSNICYYNDLGILRFFMERNGNLDKGFLFEMKKKYINPLREYDIKNKTRLEETLYCLIECNYSKIAAERKLFIHKNTLRARLIKIEQILNCDLNNSEDMFNIQLAIKIDYCIEE